MVYFLACIESVGFYTDQPYKDSNWVKNFRAARWFNTLEEAMAIPAEIYLCADIAIHENTNHSKTPLIEHRRGKYRAYCRHCNQAYGHGQYTLSRAVHKYNQYVTGKCENVILKSLQDATKLKALGITESNMPNTGMHVIALKDVQSKKKPEQGIE